MDVQEQIDYLREVYSEDGLSEAVACRDAADTLEKLNARNIKLEAVYEAAKEFTNIKIPTRITGPILLDALAAVEE